MKLSEAIESPGAFKRPVSSTGDSRRATRSVPRVREVVIRCAPVAEEERRRRVTALRRILDQEPAPPAEITC